MITLVSIALIATTIWLLVKQKKAAAAAGAVVLLILAIARPFLVPSLADRAARFDRKTKTVMADVLAAKVLERHPGKRIALVVGPEIEGLAGDSGIKMQDVEVMLANAFRQLGVTPIITPLPLDDATRNQLARAGAGPSDDFDHSPEMALYTAITTVLTSYDARQINGVLLNLRHEADVVVWTPPMFAVIRASQLLPVGEGPELVLIKGNVDDLNAAFNVSVLDMYLTYRENASWKIDYEWPSDREKAFDDRYIIATRERPAP
jgi:hypothetical protein